MTNDQMGVNKPADASAASAAAEAPMPAGGGSRNMANYPLLPDLTYIGDTWALTSDPFPDCAK